MTGMDDRDGAPGSRSIEKFREFFSWSMCIDQYVLKPLSHIAGNWEAEWDHDAKKYAPEASSFAEDLNQVIELVATCPRPLSYHDHEDILAERAVRDSKWPIGKQGSRWVGADYVGLLERGAFGDLDQRNLIAAAAGRVHAAMARGQKHIDDMEDRHRYMLAALLSIIIYHRHCGGKSLVMPADEEG
ncbi:hypothetical protein SAMN02990966_02897 [Rhodospirillales bacterium URHD0017]|nr:hypothetical protein SAMN02990966_02897 [Rhodospirillales bacterium URHD0017]